MRLRRSRHRPPGSSPPVALLKVALSLAARSAAAPVRIPGSPLFKDMAEREGFEPSVRFYPYNRLAGGCLQPTRPPLRQFPYKDPGGGSRIPLRDSTSCLVPSRSRPSVAFAPLAHPVLAGPPCRASAGVLPAHPR